MCQINHSLPRLFIGPSTNFSVRILQQSPKQSPKVVPPPAPLPPLQAWWDSRASTHFSAIVCITAKWGESSYSITSMTSHWQAQHLCLCPTSPHPQHVPAFSHPAQPTFQVTSPSLSKWCWFALPLYNLQYVLTIKSQSSFGSTFKGGQFLRWWNHQLFFQWEWRVGGTLPGERMISMANMLQVEWSMTSCLVEVCKLRSLESEWGTGYTGLCNPTLTLFWPFSSMGGDLFEPSPCCLLINTKWQWQLWFIHPFHHDLSSTTF